MVQSANRNARQSSVDPPIEAPLRSGREGCRRAQSRSVRSRNYTWAQLMHQVLTIDVLQCDRCGGRMRILAAIHSPLSAPAHKRPSGQ
jgi:hypothetical protein